MEVDKEKIENNFDLEEWDDSLYSISDNELDDLLSDNISDAPTIREMANEVLSIPKDNTKWILDDVKIGFEESKKINWKPSGELSKCEEDNTEDDVIYVAPKRENELETIQISNRRKYVRKLVSLVRPHTKKVHVALWKYVVVIKKNKELEKLSQCKEIEQQNGKTKAYISKDAKIYIGPEAFKQWKYDKLSPKTPKERYGLGVNTSNECELAYWGLPKGIVEGFHKYTKIRKLFEWQISLLKSDGVFNGGKSMIYFAPTSGGKSLPAELIMLHNIFMNQKRWVYILPYVSIVNEKTQYLKRIWETSNVRIEEFCGQSENVWTPNVDIAVCTIEKANSLLNKTIEEGWYRDLHIFVFDELHMIKDPHRGYQIEYILSKLKALEKLEKERVSSGLTWSGEALPHSHSYDLKDIKKFQIIGMSATMGKSDKLIDWLECDLSTHDFRPVPLTEYYCVSGDIYNKEGSKVLSLSTVDRNYTNQIIFVIQQYYQKMKSVILFWNTKNLCERLAQRIAASIPQNFTWDKSEMSDIVTELSQSISKSK